MAEKEEEEQVGKNKRIRPREQARGQKLSVDKIADKARTTVVCILVRTQPFSRF